MILYVPVAVRLGKRREITLGSGGYMTMATRQEVLDTLKRRPRRREHERHGCIWGEFALLLVTL